MDATKSPFSDADLSADCIHLAANTPLGDPQWQQTVPRAELMAVIFVLDNAEPSREIAVFIDAAVVVSGAAAGRAA